MIAVLLVLILIALALIAWQLWAAEGRDLDRGGAVEMIQARLDGQSARDEISEITRQAFVAMAERAERLRK